MANFTKKFGIATLFMWVVVTPIAQSFGFNHDFLPGMAMKEASDKHEPVERFLAVATTLGGDGNGLLFPEDSPGRQKLSE